MSQHTTPSPESRRSFLKTASIVAPASALLAASAAEASNPRLGYRLPDLYPGWNSRNFHEIQNDENAHVKAILQILGTSARPRPNFKNILQPNLLSFVQLAQVLENTGSAAYLGAAPVILDRTYLASAASIAEVESYHSGYLNTLLNLPIVPAAENFVVPFTIGQVVTNALYFLVDLNGGPPLTFDTHNPSDQNDTAILNFALALEYLEQDFYNANVPRFFP